MLRFVADPDGRIIPDLLARLPGRGVWVTCEASCVTAAIERNSFARGLKRPVQVEPGLEALAARLLRSRALDALALANKAGLVIVGFSRLEAALLGEPLAALVHSDDAGPDGCRKLDKLLARQGEWADPGEAAGDLRPIVGLYTRSELSLALGRSNVVHAGLRNGGASLRFLNESNRLGRYTADSGLGADAARNEKANTVRV